MHVKHINHSIVGSFMKDVVQQEVSFTGHIPQVMITGHCMFY